jgi:subtilisin-like proprotein convertase family protein
MGKNPNNPATTKQHDLIPHRIIYDLSITLITPFNPTNRLNKDKTNIQDLAAYIQLKLN